MKLKKVLFVGMYPDNVNEYRNVFFRNLIYAIADTGIQCTVISPVPVTKYRNKTKEIPHKFEDSSPNGKKIEVYYPRYFSLSNKKIGIINSGVWSERLFQHAALSVAKGLNENFDAVYGHFFVSGGLAAIKIGNLFNIPSFVAYGECNYYSEVVNLYRDLTTEDINGLSGIISVSTHNADILKSMNIFHGIPIIIAPNSVDTSLFYKMDRNECRNKLGLPQNKFIVGFVGGFIERKGDKRLLSAVNRIGDVFVAFAGRGADAPSGDKVVFCQTLDHDSVPIFLNAIDVFCLPTQNEGSCNTLVEAASCGLPIISSDLPFNDDLLTKENSIRINPNSIDEIENAIKEMYFDQEKRTILSDRVKSDAEEFCIERRCEKIISFMNKVLEQRD